MTRITRVEIITDTGRDYVCWEEDNDITVSYQDDGRTLKVFVNTMKPKSPAEEAFKRVYGYFPTEPNWDDDEVRWESFQKGYNASKVIETPQEPEKEPEKWDVVRESVKWCEEHQNESVEDYLKPHTPEQTEKLLREAFQKVQQTEEWKETQRKIDAPKESWMNKSDEELVAMLEKNPPKCLEFQLGKSLEDRIYKWWETCFVHHPEWSMEECVEDLLDIITLFLPGEQNSEGTQNIDTVVAVEAHNELLQKIKSKLRNKKA